MPATEFEQPARRIGGGGGRGRAWLAVWVVGLAGIAVAGIAGRSAISPPEAGDVARASASPAPGGASPQIAQALTLREPSPEPLTTVALYVRGTADEIIQEVDLVLLRADEPVARQTVKPTRRGLFGGLFTLGAPRAAGSLTLVATGRDRHGVPVVTVRRPVQVGALAAGAAVPRPPLGEDGGMGSRGVDLAALFASASGASAGGEARLVAPRTSWPVGRLGWQANPAQS